MKNEISTFTLIRLNIEEAIEKLLVAGWKRIEVMCEGHGYEMLSWDDQKMERLASLLASHQATINFHAPISTFNPAIEDEKVQQETLLIWGQCMRLANYFNSNYVLFHPGRAEDKELGVNLIREFFAGRIKDVPEGCQLILENVPPYKGEIGINSEELLKIGLSLPEKRWGIFFDTGHSYLYSKELFKTELEKILPFVRGFHVNDNHGEVDEHLAIGRGSIPFDFVISKWKENSYYINYEMNSIEDAHQSREKVNNWNIREEHH